VERVRSVCGACAERVRSGAKGRWVEESEKMNRGDAVCHRGIGSRRRRMERAAGGEGRGDGDESNRRGKISRRRARGAEEKPGERIARLPSSRHRPWVRSHLERWRLRRRERRRVLGSEPSSFMGVAIATGQSGAGAASGAVARNRTDFRLRTSLVH
jgi:hypothetical protein